MSATNELLLEQIKLVEGALALARSDSDEVAVVSLQQRLRKLQAQFAESTSALTEGKSIIKG